MKMRRVVYQKLVRWTAIPLLVLMWLMLVTGPGLFKGEILRRATLGLINPATAGKWHAVWLPPITAVLLYLHTTMGLQLLVSRIAWLKPKVLWEVLVGVAGLAGLGQFLWLFYG